MKLRLENVGKISYADIEFNGITVIAGENNTGKSTIGKMLFCIFHAFYRIEEQIREEREKSISRVLSDYYHEAAGRLTRRFDTLSLAEHIVNHQEMFLEDTRLLTKEIENYFTNKDKYFEQYINQERLEKLAERIYSFLMLGDKEIQKIILQKRLEAEFAMKVGHLNRLEENTKVRLSIKNGCIDFDVIKNKDIVISSYMSLNKEIIYMDDPFVLDDLGNYYWSILLNEFGHRQDLLKKLVNEKKQRTFQLLMNLLYKRN